MPIKNTESKLVLTQCFFLGILAGGGGEGREEESSLPLSLSLKANLLTSQILELSFIYVNLSFSETACRVWGAENPFS